MTFKKKVVPALAITIISIFVLTATPAFAETKTNNNPFSGLIQFISQKFGLDQNKVQTAVNDYKTQQKTTMQREKQDNEQNRLDNLVKQGKITSAQEKLILDELKTLREKYNPAKLKDLTPEERKAQMDKEKAEIETWAKENNIDPKYITPGFGGLGFRGGHKGFLEN
jgi:hypothetical protein